jgi:tuftelin-interacting protein 11
MSLSHLYRDGEGHLDDDDDDERENFEITDWDLQNEFNPNRQRHWQTKEEATYGVWAERDSDEERPSFGGKRYCVLGCMPWVWRIGKASQKSFLPL